MVFRVDPEDAAWAGGELPEPPEPPEPLLPVDELPHAAITSTAAAAPAGTSHLFRMTCLRSDEFNLILIPRSTALVRSRMVSHAPALTDGPQVSRRLRGGCHAWFCGAMSPGSGSIGWPGRYICGGLFPASCPPSMGITAPVMNEDWSEQSQSTVCATSPAVPVLAIGVDIPASRWARGPAACRWWVRIGPGATTLTRMPRSA